MIIDGIVEPRHRRDKACLVSTTE